MTKHDLEKSYSNYIDNLQKTLKASHTSDQIMQLAVGGAFEIIGILERELLIQHGMQENDYLIDVGCGSGRLAYPLSDYLRGQYLGTDIVPALVDHARELVSRPDWRFEVTQGLTIPERDAQADIVCFFSVFTHLRHEETYLYLQEAKRVLKPTGKIVFSFLQFPNPNHWKVFKNNIASVAKDKPLNQFMSLDAIKIWAYHLDMRVVTLNKVGSVSLSRDFPLKNGHVLRNRASLGQSVCVLAKSSLPTWRQKLNNALFQLTDYLQHLQI